jgi:hypothetical protein
LLCLPLQASRLTSDEPRCWCVLCFNRISSTTFNHPFSGVTVVRRFLYLVVFSLFSHFTDIVSSVSLFVEDSGLLDCQNLTRQYLRQQCHPASRPSRHRASFLRRPIRSTTTRHHLRASRPRDRAVQELEEHQSHRVTRLRRVAINLCGNNINSKRSHVYLTTT